MSGAVVVTTVAEVDTDLGHELVRLRVARRSGDNSRQVRDVWADIDRLLDIRLILATINDPHDIHWEDATTTPTP